MTTKNPTENQYALYNKLCGARRTFAARVEEDGANLRELSDAALAGEDVEGLVRGQLNRQQLQNLCAAIDDAKRRLRDRLAEAEGAVQGVPVKTLQHLPGSADELRRLISGAIQNRRAAQEAANADREARRRYDEAMSEYSELRFGFIRNGDEEVVATEKAKAAMQHPEYLWPPGSTGEVRGRDLSSVLMPS